MQKKMNQNKIVLQKFESYMDQFRIPHGQSTTESTHTCMGYIFKKMGAFIVPEDRLDEFFQQYMNVVFENGIPLHLTERPLKEIGILKFDFDFKYESDTLERKFDSEKSITFLIDTILKVLKKITTEKKNDREFDAYVFQRNQPYFQKEKTVKDGIHIIYPYYNIDFKIHHMIRHLCIKELERNDFKKMFYYENDIDDIVDKAVIQSSGWLMHGSTKPNVSPYQLKYIFDENMHSLDITNICNKELCRLVSIRKKLDYITQVKIDGASQILLTTKQPKMTTKRKNADNLDESNESESKKSCINVDIPNITYIEKMVASLNYERCMDYAKWLEVGMCLHNISENLFQVWIYFSVQNFDEITSREMDDGNKEEWECIMKSKKNLSDIQDKINRKYIHEMSSYVNSCREKWCSFKKKSQRLLNIGSLIYWCKKDNPKLFKMIGYTDYKNMIQDAVNNPSHNKLAKILYMKYQNQFVCADYEKNIWFEWDKHCWKEMDGISTIRRKITGTTHDIKDCIVYDFKQIKEQIVSEKLDNNKELQEMKNEVQQIKDTLDSETLKLKIFKDQHGASSTNPNLESQVKSLEELYNKKQNEYKSARAEIYKTYVKPYEETIQKFLETSSSIDNVVKEAKQEFYDKLFRVNMNANTQLFLFNNGVFDLENMIFREGRPDDYITMNTDVCQINYKKYDLESSEEIKEIEKYFEQVLVDTEKRNFFLTLIASCLEGQNINNIFPILTGNGSNAKTLTLGFIEQTFGMYAGKLNCAFLTQKRNRSNSASPEYHGIIDCRIVSSEESDTTDELNTAIIKDITGNGKVTSRTLYQSKMTSKIPQFTPFLICNELPNIKSNDGGTWRRIVVIPFDSKFVDDPQDPKWSHLENVFKVDRNLKLKMDSWHEPFVYMLIHKYYKLYKENGKNLIPPECVKAYTNKYKDDNDLFQPFIEIYIDTTGCRNDCIKIRDLYQRVLVWFRENFQGEKEPSQAIVKKYFESKFGPYDITKGWTGKKIFTE